MAEILTKRAFERSEMVLTADWGIGASLFIDPPGGRSTVDFAALNDHIVTPMFHPPMMTEDGSLEVRFGETQIELINRGDDHIQRGVQISIEMSVLVDEGEGALPPRCSVARMFFVDLGAPAAASANAIATSQACTASGGLASGINGALANGGQAKLDVPRNVVAAWTGTAQVTITGTDEYGRAVTETSDSGTSLTGKKAFARVTGVSSNADVTGLTVGTGALLGLPSFVQRAPDILSVAAAGATSSGTAATGDLAPAETRSGDARGTIQPAATLDGATDIRVMAALRAAGFTNRGAASADPEAAGDVDLPIISNAVDISTGSRSGQISVDVSIAEGSVYAASFAVAPTGTAAEIADAIKAEALSNGYVIAAIGAVGTKTAPITGLEPGTAYPSFWFVHETPLGFSNAIEADGFTTDAEAPAQMAAPTITATGPNEITFTFAADPDDGGSAINGYGYQVTATSDTLYASPYDEGGQDTSATFVLTGVPWGAYKARALAGNAVGDGPWSGDSGSVTVADEAPAVSGAPSTQNLTQNAIITPIDMSAYVTAGNNLTYAWAPSSGSVPGLSIDATTGLITGTPTTATTAAVSLVVRVSNNGGSQFADVTFLANVASNITQESFVTASGGPYFMDTANLGASIYGLTFEIIAKPTSFVPTITTIATMAASRFELNVLAGGGSSRLTVRDSTNTSVLSAEPLGIPLSWAPGEEHRVVVSVDMRSVAQGNALGPYCKIWKDGAIVVNVAMNAGSGLLDSSRKLTALASSSGANQFIGSVKSARFWKAPTTDGDTTGLGAAHATIVGPASAANAHPWKLGSNATDLSATLSAPFDTATGTTTASVGASVDMAGGTMYGALLPSAPADGAALEAAATYTLSVTTAGAQTANVTGLTPDTAYDPVYWVYKSAGGVYSNIVSGNGFTTAAPPAADASISLTYAVDGDWDVYNLYDEMIAQGFKPPKDFMFSNLRYSLDLPRAGVSEAGRNGYLWIDTSFEHSETVVLTAEWDSSTITGDSAGSFTAEIDVAVSYSTTMRIGHKSAKGVAEVGRVVASALPSVPTIVTETLSGSPTSIFAITGDGVNARLHFKSGVPNPTPGAVYTVTLSTGAVITVTIDAGTTVANLAGGTTSVNTSLNSTARGEFIYVRGGNVNIRDDATAPARMLIKPTVAPTGTGYREIRPHAGELVKIDRVEIKGTAALAAYMRFANFKFLTNRSGNTSGANTAFQVNGHQFCAIEDCDFHSTVKLDIQSGDNSRVLVELKGGANDFVMKRVKLIDGYQGIKQNEGWRAIIQDVDFIRIAVDGLYPMICGGSTYERTRHRSHFWKMAQRTVTGVTTGATTTIFMSDTTPFGTGSDAKSMLIGATFSGSAPVTTELWPILSKTATSVTLGINSTAWGTWVSGGYFRGVSGKHGDNCQFPPPPSPAAYNPATSYVVGNKCLNAFNGAGGIALVCIAPTTGTFDASKWDYAREQSDLVISGWQVIREHGVWGFPSGQGIYQGGSEYVMNNSLIEGILVNGPTNHCIEIRSANTIVRSCSGVNPLALVPNLSHVRGGLVENHGFNSWWYDCVSNETTLGLATWTNCITVMPTFNDWAFPDPDPADVADLAAIFQGTQPIGELDFTEAEFAAFLTVKDTYAPLASASPKIGAFRNHSQWDWTSNSYTGSRPSTAP